MSPHRSAALAFLAVVLIGGVIGLMAGLGAFDRSGELGDGVVAKVGETAITRESYDGAIAQYRAQLESSGEDAPAEGSDEDKMLRSRLLQDLILREVYRVEALECGKPCLITEKKIDAEIDMIIEQNFEGQKAAFERFLSTTGLAEKDARDQVAAFLRLGALQKFHGGKATRTLADAREYYAANPAEFLQPAALNVSHILVENEAAAIAARARLVAGEDFGALAKELSTDTGSAQQAGRLGAFQEGQFVPAFEAAVKELEDGELSEPVMTQFGWHLITAERTPERTLPFSDVRRSLLENLRQQEVADRVESWQSAVLEKWKAMISYDASIDDPFVVAERAAAEAEAEAERAQTTTAPTP
ncbi:peptidylprolyl isomerase [Miltoncostaea oceani]|uniref:peptidylprolyl isomerase n=1 Tax=Miltoncostaea oceani TaxID=2843216 RepID=UPI001C3DAF56|nr:peptidylprolyl isomerase [Miltoncostaea oceani]